MTKELFFSSSPHETKVALLEEDQVVEVYYQRDTDVGLVGGIYKGRVSRVLPGMQSAFVNIGLERDAFLYVSDFLEDAEEYDRFFAEAETRVARYTEEAEKSAVAGQQEPALATRPADTSGAEVTNRIEADELASEAASVESGAHEKSAAVMPAAPLVSSATAPVETSAPPAAVAATPPFPARPEPPEHRHSDYRGRRRGRRGRGFRQSWFTPRADRPGRSEHTAQPTFEVLPGESLAKHSQTSPEISQVSAPGFASPELAALETASFESAPSEPRFFGSEAASLSPLMEVSQTPLPEDHSANQTAAAALAGEEAQREQVITLAISSDATSDTHCESATETGGRQQSVAALSPGATGSPQMEPREEDDEELPERTPESHRDTGTVTDEIGTTAAQAAEESESPAAEGVSAEGTRASTDGAERPYTLRESSQRPRFASRRGRRGRGRFGRRYTRPEGTSVREPSRPGNDHPAQIAELLKEGQEILVQIAKEPLGTKGARITSHIALPGRYLVYMPTITHIGVSRKIASEEERFRLRNIISENRGSLTGGFIVRTAGAGRTEEELKADLNFLSNLWSEIRTRAERTKAPALLHSDLTLVQRILRDTLSPDFKTVRVDNEIEYERAVEFVNRCQPSLVGHVKLYTRETPLFEEFGIQQEIDKALKPKVWLKSGGYIVINQTEALVAIDVNTGKYVGKTNRLEDTIVKTNVDAVQEIVRQIRLRDLGGIIVIDFIDMDDRRNRQKVVQALEEALSADRAPTKILSFNEFGLVALTRKRVKQSLERTLCQPCPYCSGAGWVKSVSTICNEILAEARKMAQQIEGDTMTLRLNPEVARALKLREGAMLSEFESITKKDIIIKSDPNIHQERFEIF
jgi:ribonuclease G